jgi:hypothetical protein
MNPYRGKDPKSGPPQPFARFRVKRTGPTKARGTQQLQATETQEHRPFEAPLEDRGKQGEQEWLRNMGKAPASESGRYRAKKNLRPEGLSYREMEE